ncbi:hypothetical protein E4T56_gene7186 [Termitomyces sp. T112]|nr:hypothetical protein E4T56_gene7186 [Termitomyces sp. T112]
MLSRKVSKLITQETRPFRLNCPHDVASNRWTLSIWRLLSLSLYYCSISLFFIDRLSGQCAIAVRPQNNGWYP